MPSWPKNRWIYSCRKPLDRISQSFELGFDPSVQDMFTAWSNGSALCVVPKASGFLPGNFIAQERLTVWHSVPSIARLMQMYGTLRENSLPSLRYSMFGGKELHEAPATAWRRMVPNSVIENLYGRPAGAVSSGFGGEGGCFALRFTYSGQSGMRFDRNCRLNENRNRLNRLCFRNLREQCGDGQNMLKRDGIFSASSGSGNNTPHTCGGAVTGSAGL